MGVLRNGTTANDTLTGLTAGDTLSGGLGNDVYVVNFADVVIQEGYFAGTDTIKTSYLDEAGVYSLRAASYIENLTYTGPLAASLQGNSLANVITGNTGNDTIAGGAGNDSLLGGAGDDLVSGGAGDDLLNGGTNTTAGDTMIGGAGNDTYLANSSFDQMLEGVGQGFDTISSAGTVKSLNISKFVNFEGLTYTGTTAAILTGNASSNAVTSTSATADTLYGLAGDDTLDGGAGNDSMTGGTGNDTYIVNAGDRVYEVAGEGIDTLQGTIVSINTTTAGANFATTVENLTYTGTTGATLTGNAMNNVITGGAGSDSLLGGAGVDLLIGKEAGAAAADTLVGGTGDDRYLIADRLDTVSEGADSIDGGNDWIFSTLDLKLGNAKYANVNHLALVGDAWLGEGNAANNVIVGNASSNHLSGLGGNDILIGTGSVQQTNVSGTAVNIDLPSYDYSESHDVLDGGAGNDVLIGSNLPSVYGSTSGSALLGGLGDDTYVIRSAVDTVSDSGGTDTVISLLNNLSIEDYEGIENAKLSDSTMIGELSTLVGRLTPAGVSASFSFYGAVNLTGNDLANTLTGNSFANVLDGGIGNDTLIGGDGNDTLIGGAGNDSLIGGEGNDSLVGGAGTNSLAGGNGNDIYDINLGDAIVETATGGTDAIRSSTITSVAAYANVEGLLYTGTSAVTLAGSAGTDWLGGGSGNDTLTGLGGNDTLSGGSGADRIDGGADNDSLSGDSGNDTLLGQAGNDTIGGGDGADSLDGGADNDSLSGDLGNDTIDGGVGSDQIYGGQGSDSLHGGDGSDTIYAGTSPYDYYGIGDAATDVNRLFGDAGDDALYGAAGADTLDGGADSDQLYGKGGNDSLLGGAGDDYLYGGQSAYSTDTQTGNDTLNGGAGNDTLYGGDGSDLLQADGTVLSAAYTHSGDVLFGGDGSDTFRLTEAFGTTESYGTSYFSTGHLIADFASGSDKLSILKALVGDGDTTLDSSATAVAGTASAPPATTFSHTAELVVFSGNVGLDFSYYDTTGINATNAASVATAIGGADASFAVGDKRLFVINDGSDSALFQFVSDGADAAVSAAELKLIGVIAHDMALTASDFVLA